MKKSLAFLCVAFTLTACGKDPGVASGSCNSEVISANNSAAIWCNDIRATSSRYTVERCQEKLNSFLTQFPNADCEATNMSGGGQITIRSEDFRQKKALVDRALTQ